MTLPDERYRAVLAAERLLKDLCDPSTTPRVPRAVRDRARSVLRHYPSKFDMDRAATAADWVFQTRDPVDDVQEFLIRGAEQRK
jgi:hypothetical protein